MGHLCPAVIQVSTSVSGVTPGFTEVELSSESGPVYLNPVAVKEIVLLGQWFSTILHSEPSSCNLYELSSTPFQKLISVTFLHWAVGEVGREEEKLGKNRLMLTWRYPG